MFCHQIAHMLPRTIHILTKPLLGLLHQIGVTSQNVKVPCFFSIPQVLAALKSFAPGSAAGIDGRQPQHIKDTVQMSSPEGLPAALANFLSMVLSGGVPLPIRAICLLQSYTH